MKPEETIPPISPTGTTNPKHDQFTRPSEASQDKIKSKKVQADKIKTPQLDHVRFNQIDAINSDTTDLAQGIRKVHQSLETIDSHLHKMRTALESIVKIYPPYPPGSSERIEALRQFSAFRQMIDQVAQPKRANGIENILGDPAKNPKSGDFTLRPGQGQPDLVIRHQPAHTGPGGLHVPEIDSGSSDQQINSAIEKMSSVQQALGLKRSAFIADANRMIARIS